MARGRSTRSTRRSEPESEEEVDQASSEEEEEEVFDLAAGDEDSDSSEGDSEDDSEDSDEEGEDNGRSSNIAQLLDNLDPQLRQKVIMGRGGEESESEEEDEEEEDAVDGLRESSGWGKKGNYWSGDTADLEIGQDVEDAEDEEEAAKALKAEQLSRRKESDYFEEDEFEEDFGEEEGEEDLQRPADGFGSDQLTEDLEFVATGGVREDSRSTSVEKLQRDVSKMSKKQRMALLSKEAPEMLGLLGELNDRVKELNERIVPVKTLIEQAGRMKPAEDELCLYLEVKQQLLLSYCINTTFYLMLKAEGKSVRSHPVIKQLLHLRYAMEKMRPLDGKVKYQVDRLLAVAEEAGEGGGAGALKPNVAALMGGGEDSDEEQSESEDEGAGSRAAKSGAGVYRPPRAHAVPYMDDKDTTRQEEKLQRKKKKLKNSEILETLREEFGHAPEQSSSSGIAAASQEQKQLQEEEEERRRFEEERFVRLTLSRKDKKAMKRREKLSQSQDMVADMGDIGDFEELEALSSSIAARAAGADGAGSSGVSSSSRGASGADLSSALQKAVSALTGGSSKKRSLDGDADLSGSKHRRRMAPSFDEDEDYAVPEDFGDDDDGDDDLMETFARKKKEFVQKKAEHYTAPVRVGGREELVKDGAKRAASYEIMSNRGLTPHRKKSNRNPRVKKREAFAKAVVARKGQVREVVSGSTVAYGGEATGIKANLSRSRRIGS